LLGTPDRIIARDGLRQVAAQIDKAMSLALQLDNPAPAMRKVHELKAHRRALMIEEMARLEEESAVRNVVRSVARDEVAQLVRTLAVEIDEAERPRLKEVLQAAVEQITLDPANVHCRIQYRIAAGRTLVNCNIIVTWSGFRQQLTHCPY
jgi:hypothetical protein